MPVVPKLGVPVFPIVSVIDCASIGVLVGVKPPGGGQEGRVSDEEGEGKREKGRGERGSHLPGSPPLLPGLPQSSCCSLLLFQSELLGGSVVHLPVLQQPLVWSIS